MALRGVRRLLANNKFTDCKIVSEALESYKIENSTVLLWCKEENITPELLTGSTTDRLFSDFKDWCTRSDIKFGASIRTFHKEIEEKFNLERKRARSDGNVRDYSWQFVMKLD